MFLSDNAYTFCIQVKETKVCFFFQFSKMWKSELRGFALYMTYWYATAKTRLLRGSLDHARIPGGGHSAHAPLFFSNQRKKKTPLSFFKGSATMLHYQRIAYKGILIIIFSSRQEYSADFGVRCVHPPPPPFQISWVRACGRQLDFARRGQRDRFLLVMGPSCTNCGNIYLGKF